MLNAIIELIKIYFKETSSLYKAFLFINIFLIFFHNSDANVKYIISEVIFLVFCYISIFFALSELIEKKFKIIYDLVPDLNEDYKIFKNLLETKKETIGTKYEIIKKLETNILDYFLNGILAIDFFSLIFYKNTITTSIIILVLKYFGASADPDPYV